MSGLTIGSIVVGVAGAAVAARGARRSADAIEGAADTAAGVQREALDAALAINQPFTESSINALNQINAIFGLPQVDAPDFDQIGSGRSGPPEVRQIPGATFRDADVFTDSQGNIFESRFGTLNPIAAADFGSQIGDGRHFLRTADNGGVRRAEDGSFVDDQGNVLLGPEPVEQEFVPGSATNPAPTTSLRDLIANNPAIQFRQERGERAITRGAAARGINQSPNTLKSLADFNQGLASEGIQQFVLNPLFQLAGFGPQANAQTTSAVQSNANNLSNLALTAGQARGSAFQQEGNVTGSALSNISDGLLLRSLLRNQQGGLGGTGGGGLFDRGSNARTFPLINN